MFGRKCPGDCSKCGICEKELQIIFGYEYSEEDLRIHQHERLVFENGSRNKILHKILIFLSLSSVFVYYVGKFIAPILFYGSICFGFYEYFNCNEFIYYPLIVYPSAFFLLGYLLLDKFKLLD